MSRSRSVSLSRVVAAALCLTLLVVGGKGVMLWMLSQSINAHAADIGAFYTQTINQYAVPLQAISDLTARQREAVSGLTASLLDSDASQDGKVSGIIQVQHNVMEMLNTVSGTLAARPEVSQLEQTLSRGGDVQPLLDSYNKKVQEWNLQRETGLGAVYTRLFGLKKKLLLQADGTAEYETTVTF